MSGKSGDADVRGRSAEAGGSDGIGIKPFQPLAPADAESFAKAERQNVITANLRISCKSGWERRGIIVQTGDIISFPNWTGKVTMGNGPNTEVYATGHFSNGDVQGPSDGDYPAESINKYCAVVGLAPPVISGPYIGPVRTFAIFKNDAILKWGASVGGANAAWKIGENVSGELVTCFNDNNDSDNGGYFDIVVNIVRG